jgi:hypothetical protein
MRECGTAGLIIRRNDRNATHELIRVEDIIERFTSNLDPRWTYSASFYLESVRLSVYLPSFEKATFPETFPEDSTAEKMEKLMQVEQRYQKTGLQFLRSGYGFTGQMELATVILQNRGRETQIPVIVPYLTVNQLKILGREDRLYVRCVDFGSGKLGEGIYEGLRLNDRLQIEAEWRLDLDIEYTANRPTVTSQETVRITPESTRLLRVNSNRAYFEFQNQSEGNVLLYSLAGHSRLNDAPFKLSPKQMYHPFNTQGFVPRDDIYAKAESGYCDVTVMEVSYV